MKSTLCICLVTVLASGLHAQAIKAHFNNGDYEQVIAFAGGADSLSDEEVFLLGKSFYFLDLDSQAISFFELAMAKGYDSVEAMHQIGTAFLSLDSVPRAIPYLRYAVRHGPNDQTHFDELAWAYYRLHENDSAIHYALEAVKLPYKRGFSYFLLGLMYNEAGDRDEALKHLNYAITQVSARDFYHHRCLVLAGDIEFTARNFENAVLAYRKAISNQPERYFTYENLMKAFNQMGNYVAADSVFGILRNAYRDSLLPDRMMRFRNAAIDEFDWDSNTVVTYKYFEKPVNFADPIYRMYLYDLQNDSMLLFIQTEKSIDLFGNRSSGKKKKKKKKYPVANEEPGEVHFLIARLASGTRYNYGLTWHTSNIEYESFKELALKVLEGNINAAAVSSGPFVRSGDTVIQVEGSVPETDTELEEETEEETGEETPED